MTLEEQGNEWLRRLRLPHVEVHRDFGKRYSSISLKLLGKELGSRTVVTKNKKVVSTVYFLPEL